MWRLLVLEMMAGYRTADSGAGDGGGGAGDNGGAGNGGGSGDAGKTYTAAEYQALQAQFADATTKRTEAMTKLTDATTKLTALEQAQLSDAEKLTLKAKEAEEGLTKRETELRQERLERSIEREARKLNVVDEDAALRLLDVSKIKYDDADKPTNVAELLGQLVKDKPYLVAVAGSGGSAANPSLGRGGSLTATQQIDKEFSQRGGSTGGFRI